jgi:hypothetical protein
MNKYEILIEKYPNEVNKLINKLYKEKFPQKKEKKTIFKFMLVGKTYDSDIFVNNYIDLITDISNIHPYEMFEKTRMKRFISKTNNLKQSHMIKDNFYVSTHSSTKIKIKHIEDICKFLDLNLTRLHLSPNYESNYIGKDLPMNVQ